jgi:hypothetical protein
MDKEALEAFVPRDEITATTVSALLGTRPNQVWRMACSATLQSVIPPADTLELLGKAPDPARAAKLTRAQVAAALKRAGRYKITERTEMILTALRSPQLS